MNENSELLQTTSLDSEGNGSRLVRCRLELYEYTYKTEKLFLDKVLPLNCMSIAFEGFFAKKL